MPRHRSLNLKKFIDSIPEPLIEEYFKQKVGGGGSPSLKTFDYVLAVCDRVEEEKKAAGSIFTPWSQRG